MAIALLVGLVPAVQSSAAKNVKLNITSKTLTVGKSATIKLLNNKNKVTWFVANGNIKITKKTKTYAKIKAISTGTSYLRAKIGKKKYSCKITIKEAVNITPTPQPTDTPSVEQSYISDFEIEKNEIYNGNDVSISINDYSKNSSNISIEFLVQNNLSKDYAISAHEYAIKI